MRSSVVFILFLFCPLTLFVEAAHADGGFDIGLIGVSDLQLERRLAGHTAPIHDLVFIDEGQSLLSAGHDARAFVWNVGPELEEEVLKPKAIE